MGLYLNTLANRDRLLHHIRIIIKYFTMMRSYYTVQVEYQVLELVPVPVHRSIKHSRETTDDD